MATSNRLRATIDDDHREHIETIAAKEDVAEPEAERIVVKEGLASLGFIERPTDAHDLFLWYARRMGLTLGFTGLVCMGYGVFAPRIWSVIGFGLLLTGFLSIAVVDGVSEYNRENKRTVGASTHE